MNRRLLFLLILMLIAILAAPVAFAQDNGDDVDRGAYLAVVAGCAYCHSPEGSSDFSGGAFTINGETLYAPNVTPSESGIGDWTDDELRAAIVLGVDQDDESLHPAMPYLYYNGMADDDLDAIIAYLKTLPPVESDPLPENELDGITIPSVAARSQTVNAPEREDEVAYGGYLVDSVLACGVCHTPVTEDGTSYLAGGSAFEGPWGTVYAANITPDSATGIGWMTSDQIILAMISGTHPEEQRPMYVMPSSAYFTLSGRDAQAVVNYLTSVPAIFNGVPDDEVVEGFDVLPEPEQKPPTIIEVALTGLMFLVVIAVAVYLTMRQMQIRRRVRETDWEGHFREALREAREERDRETSPD